MRDTGYEEVEHWSFASHVVQPLRYSDAERRCNYRRRTRSWSESFLNTPLQADVFDGEAYDPSANQSMDSLNTAYVPDAFSNEYYGDGTYLN